MPIAPIRYRVAMPDPRSHEVHVAIQIPAQAARDRLDIVFPVWAPGSYLVRDFSRHIYDLRVLVDGKETVPERIDKARWRVRSTGRAVSVHYRVFAFETSVRTSFLDENRAFLNGTSLFFFVEGETGRPCQLEIETPGGWRVTTALSPVGARRQVYRAANYDELVDTPVEIGTHAVFDFRVGAAEIAVAWHGPSNADHKRLLAMLKAIVQTTGDIFGGFPFKHYLFIVHALPARGGGLEHRNSCTLDIAGFSFEDERGYQRFAELAAHEFFHAWNVKRIHDRVLGPFDYTKENYTRLLWFHEGFTEYMQTMILLRAGLLGVEAYLKDLAEDYTRFTARPGRNVTPLTELSYEAWIKQYKPAENHTNRVVSYYDKGRWAGLVLDLLIRLATGGRRGLPDVFLRLWRRFGAKDMGIDMAIIQSEAETVAGRPLANYFGKLIDGTTELPVPELLRKIGVSVEAKAPYDASDPVKSARLRAWSGLAFAPDDCGNRAVIKNVVPDSPAWRAGFTYGDEIIAIGDNRVTARTVSNRLADHAPGRIARLTYFRKDRLRHASVRMASTPERRWTFSIETDSPATSRRLLQRWLGTKSRLRS